MRRIFVSSTFKDMQHERDLLHTDVIPSLNNIARAYGESIGFIDLRWGVNTAELETDEGSKKVLSVCLDEIDKSKPYMLIFLGERYGWIPDSKLLEGAVKSKNFTLDDMEKSVTALEIEYGALRDAGSLDRCVVCIRKPLLYGEMDEARKDYEAESGEHKQRLDMLKGRIRKIFGEKVIDYEAIWDCQNKKISGLEKLKDELIYRFTEMFKSEWEEKEKLSWQEKELAAFYLFTEEKNTLFQGRINLIEKYKNKIMSNDNRVLILKGQAGSGKSCVISKLFYELKNKNYDVFPFICGNSTQSITAEDMLIQMVYFAETKLGVSKRFEDGKETSNTKKTSEEWQKYFTQLLDTYEARNESGLIFFIDALDQLAKSELLTAFNFLPLHIPKNVRFVITCLDNFEIPLLGRYNNSLKCESMPLLEEADISEVVDGILKANAKDLDKAVKEEIYKKESVKNPLFVSMLLYRLMMMDSQDLAGAGNADKLNEYMINIIKNCPSSLNLMCVEILKEASGRINPKVAQLSANLIASSRRGLRETDLGEIFALNNVPWNSLDFIRFVNYMSAFFMVRQDGRYDFTHRAIRDGFLSEGENRSRYDELILEHIKTLTIDDSLRLNEGIYHAYKCDDKAFACLQMVQAHTSRYAICMLTTKELMRVCIDDSGKWVCDIIDNLHMESDSSTATDFLLYEFSTAFDITKSQNNMRLKIYLYLKSKLETIFEKEQSIETISNMCTVCERVGSAYYFSSEYKKALEVYEEHIKYRLLLYEKEDTLNNLRSLSVSYQKTGNAKYAMGAYLHALKDYEKFLELLIKISNQNNSILAPSDIPDAYENIGIVYMLLNNLTKAEEYFSKALIGYEEMHKKQNSLVSSKKLRAIYGDLGDVYNKTGKYKEAKDYYEKYLDYATQINIKENNVSNIINISIAYERMSEIYLCLTDFNKALDFAKQCLDYRIELNERVSSPTSLINLSIAYAKIGNVYKALKDLTSACEAYKKCYEYRIQIYKAQDTYVNLRNLVTSCVSLGDALREARNYQDALEVYKTFLKYSIDFEKRQSDLLGLQNLYVAYNRMVLIHTALGNKDATADYTKKFNDLKVKIEEMKTNSK